jgi:hypothetical protein
MKGGLMKKIALTLLFLVISGSISLSFPFEIQSATVSGSVAIPDSDMGYKPNVYGMKVRVEGTEISADMTAGENRYNGEFTLYDVPTGTVTLLLIEDNEDVFTQASKRVQVNVTGDDVSGVSFDLVYHWKELAGYPSPWGQTGYDEWRPHFLSDQVGFILFRVRGTGIDPERVELYRTPDGGQTWTEIGHWLSGAAVYPDHLHRTFHFTDENHGVIQALVDTNTHPDVTWYSPRGVLWTSNGGDTWQYAALPTPPDTYDISIHRFAQISTTHLIAAGTAAWGSVSADAIWESIDAGATWEIKASWQPADGCTGLGANSDGKAIAFFTPYAWGGSKKLALRDPIGNWTTIDGNELITNSGYGPADIPMVGDNAWESNSANSSLPAGLYRSDDAGLTWTQISTSLLQYMDFASENKGFALAGGPAYISYDGGSTWLYQSSGGGVCCHLDNIWAFDTTHAIWHEGGAGDPNGELQLFTYVEPWEANFEILPEVTIKNGYVKGGDANVPMASYRLFNHGPVSIRLTQLTVRASGGGNDGENITAARLWMDQNANGYVDSEDLPLAQGVYSGDNGTLSLPLDNVVLEQFIPQYLLVTYDFASGISLGKSFTLNLDVTDVEAETADTETAVAPTAPPGYRLTGRTVTAATEIFADRFESGLGSWIVDGPDPGYEWQITDTAFVSPDHSVRVGENPNHEGWATNNTLTLSQPLDFSVDGNYYLTFYHNYTLPQGYVAWVEVSTDGGAEWTAIAQYGSQPTWGFYTLDDFLYESVDLSSYAETESLLVRFRFDTTLAITTPGEWSLDDVRLSFIAFPPRVALLSPNGGEMIPSGSTYTIEWEAPPEVETFKLLYSLDNGTTWTLINKAVSDSIYSWDVPDVKGNKTKCHIKVVGYTASGAKAGMDISNGNFTIEVVTLLSPNGGQIFHPGDTTTVEWRACAAAASFDVMFSMDNGATWKNVGDGNTPVMIELEKLTGTALPVKILPPSTGNKTKCLLKVVAYNGRGAKIGEDKSDIPFSVEVVRLDSPNGGSPLNAGDETSITWTIYETAQPITRILLYYTKDGGTTWRSIDTLTDIFSPGPDSYPWTVTSVGTKAKTKCKVKIILKDEEGVTRGQDVSDAFFTIEP